MRNRYAQIALTYTDRWSMRAWLILTAMLVAWLALTRQANFSERLPMLMLGGTACVFAATIVTSQVKEQIADPRSALTPGFRTPHLIVGGVLLTATTLGLASYIAWRSAHIEGGFGWPALRIWPPGYVAIVMISAAAMAWMGYLQSPPFIFCVMALGAVFVMPISEPLNWQTISGRAPVTACVMLALALASLIALWWRMALLNEEMREYHRLDSFSPNLKLSMTGDRFYRRSAAAEVGWFNEWLRGAGRIDRARNVLGASLMRRAAHWRLAISFARANPLFGALFGMMLLVMDYFGGLHEGKGEQGVLIAVPILIGLVVPMLIAGCTWPRRWYTLAQDALRPATRRQFLAEQGAAMGWELMSLWFWITVGALLPTIWYRPHWLLSATTLAMLALTAAEQVLLFAVFVWIARYRGTLFFTWTLTLLAVAAAGFLFVHEIGHADDRLRIPSPLVIAAVLVVALPVLVDAYRRWLRTDLD